MDVVMGNNGNVARLNVAHEVRRYVAGGRRRQAATLRKTKPVASGFIPDVPGFVPDVKPGFIPTLSGNVADKLRRYEKTKPVASGLVPDVKRAGLKKPVASGFIPDVPGFVPDVKPGFTPTSPGNVADKLRRYEKPWETKPVASGFIPDVKTGLAPDVKSGPSRRPSAKNRKK